MQTPMTSCHLIPTWHKWNANAYDIMMMWFILYASLITSHQGMMCMHVHGTHALCRNSHLSNQVAWHTCKLTQT